MTTRLLHLVRHGETAGESSVRYWGRTDVPLSEVGRGQMRALLPRLAGERYAAVVHSPLSRARESAEILLAGLRARPAVVEAHAGLREVDFGAIEGLTRPEIEARWPEWYRTWQAGLATGYPEGDTHLGFAARIAAALDEVLARHSSGDLLLVVHRGVIKRALQHCLRLTAEQAMSLEIGLASLTVLRAGPRFELVELGHVPRAPLA